MSNTTKRKDAIFSILLASKKRLCPSAINHGWVLLVTKVSVTFFSMILRNWRHMDVTGFGSRLFRFPPHWLVFWLGDSVCLWGSPWFSMKFYFRGILVKDGRSVRHLFLVVTGALADRQRDHPGPRPGLLRKISQHVANINCWSGPSFYYWYYII
jgi:hypothetical protein